MNSPTLRKVGLGVVHVKAVACLELHLLSYLQRLPFAARCAVLQSSTQHLVSGVQRENLHRFDDCVFAKIKLNILHIAFGGTLQEDGLALGVSARTVVDVIQLASGVSPRATFALAENIVTLTFDPREL